MRTRRFVVAIMASAACACASVPGARTTRGSSNQQAAEELRRSAAAWADASNARDGATMSEYFDDGVIAMYPRRAKPEVGKQANRAGWIRSFASPGFTHPLQIDSVVVSAGDDMAYTYGRWHLTKPGTPANGGALDIGGRFVAIWRRTGEASAWRIVILSAQEQSPAPPMVTP